MRTLAAAGAVLRDVVWLTVVQPVREGRPRSAGWPVGLAPIVASILTLYGLLTLAVVFAGPLRGVDSLVVTASGLTIPDIGAWLCIAGVVLSIAPSRSGSSASDCTWSACGSQASASKPRLGPQNGIVSEEANERVSSLAPWAKASCW